MPLSLNQGPELKKPTYYWNITQIAGRRNTTRSANNEGQFKDKNNAQLPGPSMQPTSKHEIQSLD
jgi:hypothetical protein